MATPVFHHGKDGTIQIGGTFFAAEQFSYTGEVDLEDITYCQGVGTTSQILIPGYKKASGTITFVWDSANLPTVSPQQLTEGTLMALTLYPDGAKAFSVSAYSGSFGFSSGPKAGACRCTTSWRSTGPFTEPTS